VAFDPKYLAMSGDNPTICIWRACDDWGLEAGIDSSSGNSRSMKRRRAGSPKAGGGDHVMEDMEGDPGGTRESIAVLSHIDLPQWQPHLWHQRGTRGKNITAMISREGWAASGQKPADGTNQPALSRVFLGPIKEVGLLVKQVLGKGGRRPGHQASVWHAGCLGNKRGFVTLWSTKSSRPLFKMQCSESPCTVTESPRSERGWFPCHGCLAAGPLSRGPLLGRPEGG